LVGPIVPADLIKDLATVLADLGGGKLRLVSDAWGEGPVVLDVHVLPGLHAGRWKVIASSRQEGGELDVLLYTVNHRVREVAADDGVDIGLVESPFQHTSQQPIILL
jgi:hypothetical protein